LSTTPVSETLIPLIVKPSRWTWWLPMSRWHTFCCTTGIGVGVGVTTGVDVGEAVGVAVGVAVGDAVGVTVGVSVGVGEVVGVIVGVSVGVALGVGSRPGCWADAGPLADASTAIAAIITANAINGRTFASLSCARFFG
jgi:hypothetical protein